MANKQKSKETEKKPRSRVTASWLKTLSYIAILILAFGLLLSFILQKLDVNSTLAEWIKHIAILLILPIPIFLSFFEARSKKTAWQIVWLVAVVIIVVFYFLGIVL